jgi:hypothetical protein
MKTYKYEREVRGQGGEREALVALLDLIALT